MKNRYTDNNEISNLHNQLLKYSQDAGFSESAKAILYKISNIINSAITSISILEVKMQNNSLNNLYKTIKLLKENQLTINNYLTKHPIGSKIPEYLILLGNQLEIDIKLITKEIYHTFKNLKQIKHLVHSYKTANHLYAYNTKIILSNTIDHIIQCFSNIISKYNIIITTDYKDCNYLFTDQEKLTQILMNLINNAIDALILHNQPSKTINIYIKRHSSSLIKISIQDNGIGIDLKNIAKIFSFNFTTKSNGHGFNLYNSYIKAKELGGILRVMSPGIGLGAIFTLILPNNLNYANT